jgi:hypothetical protein
MDGRREGRERVLEMEKGREVAVNVSCFEAVDVLRKKKK